MGSSGGGGQTDYSTVAFQNAMNAGAQGQPWEHVQQNFNAAGMGNMMSVAQMGYNMGAPAPQSTGFHEAQMPQMPHMPSQQYDTSAADAAQAAADAQALADGQRDRDTGYGNYLDAGQKATNYVDTQLANERANSALLGIDYSTTDEVRQGRINDYFGTLWSETNQRDLENLIGEYGDPTGFQGYTFTRGEGGYYDTQEGSEAMVAVSGGGAPGSFATDEEEDALGRTSILGV